MPGDPAQLTCLVCDRSVDPAEPDLYHPPRFEDVCICGVCLAGERNGYGENANRVRRQLERLARSKSTG